MFTQPFRRARRSLRSVAALVSLLATTVLVVTASSGAATETEYIASVDATVTDVNLDGAGDWVYDEQSVVTGYFHPALGLGEHRGVYEFDLGSAPAGVVRAALALNSPGSFGTDPPDPRLILSVGPGDGQVTVADFTPLPSQLVGQIQVNLNPGGTTLDITNALQAVAPSRFIRIVLAPHPSTLGTQGGLLFGSRENELAHGYEFRTARLLITVDSAQQLLVDLIALVDSYKLGQLGTALHEKLVTVQAFLVANKPQRACNVLDRFFAQVKEQRGKRISVEQADRLNTDARRIKTVIGC